MDSALDTPFNSPPPSTPVLRPMAMCDKGISPILLTDALVHLEAEIHRLEAQSSDDKMSSSPPSPARGVFRVQDFIELLAEERSIRLARRLKEIRVMKNRHWRRCLSEGSEDGKSEDGKSEDGKSEDGKSEDGKSEDGKSEKTGSDC